MKVVCYSMIRFSVGFSIVFSALTLLYCVTCAHLFGHGRPHLLQSLFKILPAYPYAFNRAGGECVPCVKEILPKSEPHAPEDQIMLPYDNPNAFCMRVSTTF